LLKQSFALIKSFLISLRVTADVGVVNGTSMNQSKSNRVSGNIRLVLLSKRQELSWLQVAHIAIEVIATRGDGNVRMVSRDIPTT
jgi:hypothetical protein